MIHLRHMALAGACLAVTFPSRDTTCPARGALNSCSLSIGNRSTSVLKGNRALTMYSVHFELWRAGGVVSHEREGMMANIASALEPDYCTRRWE